MKYISSDLVSSSCDKANSQYYVFLESVIYLMCSFLVFGVTVIGGYHLARLIPKVGNIKNFMSISMATSLLLLGTFYPMFIKRGKKKNQKIVQEAEEKLSSFVDILGENDVKTTVDLLKVGYLEKDTSCSFDEEFGKRVFNEFNKFYFEDLLGKYRILKEKISEIYSESDLQKRYSVYLLDENEYDKQDKYIIKKLKKH